MKIPPFEVLIGIVPKAQLTPVQNETPLGARKEQLTMTHKRAYDTILHSQMIMIKDTTFIMHHKG
jgi:hypothetical protein